MNATQECASKRPVVFITGANGFIGRALGAYFSDKGFAVCGVDRGADPARFVVAGDIVDPSPWQAQLEGCAVVVHTAAVVSNAVPAVQQWQINVLGTRRVIEAAARAKVGRVVHLSSVRAYGDLGFPDTVEESWPLRPDGHAYVDTKVASEAVAFDYLTRTGGYSRVKAERVLGWVPRISLDVGMSRTEAWLRAEGHLTRT